MSLHVVYTNHALFISSFVLSHIYSGRSVPFLCYMIRVPSYGKRYAAVRHANGCRTAVQEWRSVQQLLLGGERGTIDARDSIKSAWNTWLKSDKGDNEVSKV